MALASSTVFLVGYVIGEVFGVTIATILAGLPSGSAQRLFTLAELCPHHIWQGAQSMFEKLINLIFGCKHPERYHSALPFTQDGQSYRICLKCGTPIGFSVEDFEYITPGYRRRKRRRAARA